MVPTVSEGVVISDVDGQVLFVNRAGKEQLGYSVGERLESKDFRLSASPLRFLSAKAIFETTRNQGGWTGEIIGHKSSGEEVALKLSAELMVEANGHPLGIVIVATDLTERRLFEKHLLQCQKAEIIGRLSAGIAHDFGNLLMTVRGYSQMIEREIGAGEGLLQISIHGIYAALTRASDLSGKLLAFALQPDTEPRMLSLRDLILDMVLILRPITGEDIELVTMPSTDPGLVKIDPVQIELCLANLVVNARDALLPGGKIFIKTALVTLSREYALGNPGVTPGDYVMLEVSDTGAGMNEEVKAHIFEPFYTTKRPASGAGLGLSICHWIVSQIGGHITVESQPGEGATFRVYLPQAHEEANR